MRALARPLWPSNRTPRIRAHVLPPPLLPHSIRNSSTSPSPSPSPSSSPSSFPSSSPLPHSTPPLSIDFNPAPPPPYHPPPPNGHTETSASAQNETVEPKSGSEELPKKDPRRAPMIVPKIEAFLNKVEPSSLTHPIDLIPMLLANGVYVELADRIMKVGKRAKQFKDAEYGAYILAVGKLGELEKVMAALSEMENEGLTPDANALNGLLHALAAHGKLDTIHTIIATRLREWPEARRDEPFGILARYYLRIGQLEKAEAMVGEVEKRGLAVGAGIANPLLGFYADQVYVKNHGAGRSATTQEAARMWEESQKLVGKMLAARGAQDTSTYFYRMKILIACAPPAQWDALLAEVENSRVHVETRLYNLVAHAYTQKGDIPRVAALVTRMRNAGETPDTFTMTTLVKACLMTKDLAGLRILAENTMNAEVTQTTIPVYNSLIDAFYKLGDNEMSDKILNHMLAQNLQPNSTTFNTILSRYFKSYADGPRCLTIFQTMIKSGVKPDRATYDMMMTVYSKMDDLQKCREMFDALCKICEPHFSTYCLMATMYIARRDSKTALEIIAQARARGRSNAALMRVEIYAHAAAHDVARVNAVYEDLLREHKQPHHGALFAYIRTNLDAQNDVCARVLDDARRLNVPLDARHYHLMLAFLARNKKFETLRMVKEYMQEMNAANAKQRTPNPTPPPSPPTSSSPSPSSSSSSSPSRPLPPGKKSQGDTKEEKKETKRKKEKNKREPSQQNNTQQQKNNQNNTQDENYQINTQDKNYQNNTQDKNYQNITQADQQQIQNTPPEKEKGEEKGDKAEEIEDQQIQRHLHQLQLQIQEMQQLLLQKQQNKQNPPKSQNPQISQLSELSQNSQTLQNHQIPQFPQFSQNLQNPQNLKNPQNSQNGQDLQNSQNAQNSQNSQTSLNNALSHLQVTSELSLYLSFNYNQLLNDACARGDLRQCGYLLYHMALAGLRIDARAYAGLLSAALTQGNDALAAQVIAEMEANEAHTSVNSADMYNIILAHWVEKGEHEKCRALLRHMRGAGVQPNGVTQELVERVAESKDENKNYS